VGTELFHVDRRKDGRTDMTKLIVDFSNFTNAPKKGCHITHMSGFLTQIISLTSFIFYTAEIGNYLLQAKPNSTYALN